MNKKPITHKPITTTLILGLHGRNPKSVFESGFMCSPCFLHPPPAPRSPDVVTMGSLNQKCSSPGGRLGAPPNAKAKSTGPKKIQLSWDPPPGNPMGYKVGADGPTLD